MTANSTASAEAPILRVSGVYKTIRQAARLERTGEPIGREPLRNGRSGA